VPLNVNSAEPRILRFGTYELDSSSRELRKHGLRVALEGKPFEILVTLLESAGRVVTRKALRQKLWPDSYVGFEHSLNTAMNKLRESLADSPKNPRYVETLPRVGYRFIASVQKVEQQPERNRKTMLAVLPLENLSGESEPCYFADGLTEELISQLGQLNPQQLGVIARTSTLAYKGAGKNIAQIAEELNVTHLLEGSVRLDKKKRARITLQLIQASDQSHIWAASYDHDLRQVLNVQKNVADQVGKSLQLKLLPSRHPKPVAANPEAHEAYLQGRHFCGQRSEESIKRAMTCFEQALLLDPQCARACSGLADCCSLLTWFGALWPREAGSRASLAAARALEIDPALGEAYASMGLVRYWHGWDWQGAEEMFRQAIERNPSYAMARQWYASFLNAQGRMDEALSQLLLAREFDPHALIIQMNMADPPFFARDYDRAVSVLLSLLEHAPHFSPALFNLGRSYVQLGRHSDAIAAFEQAIHLSGNREGRAALAHAYALAGRSEKAREILDEMKQDCSGRYVASPMIARIHLGFEEVDEAFLWLEKGFQERSYWMVFLKMDPVYDAIRGDARFQDLLRRL